MCNVYLGGEKGIDKVLRNTISISYERSVWVFWLSFVEKEKESKFSDGLSVYK